MSTAYSYKLRKRRGINSSTPPFISFGPKSTFFLGLFALVYITCLLALRPSLHDDSQVEKFVQVKHQFIEREQNIIRNVKSTFHHLRNKQTNTQNEGDAADKAWDSFHQRIKNRHELNPIVENGIEIQNNNRNINIGDVSKLHLPFSNLNDKPTKGVVVLGMHRSGTSMLSGLLVEGFGYQPGQPLIGAAFDNEKGFFELVPAVLQNDEFLKEQHMHWASINLNSYDAERALRAKEEGKIDFRKGERALKLLNEDQSLVPWLQKDPRMCITFRTWLPLLNSKPAVIFTYRHPLEVAMSLNKRENDISIRRGLRLWILYNQSAIINSADMCVIYTSNESVFANPMEETKRIVKLLSEKCDVPIPPRVINSSVIDRFIDPTLRHNKKLEPKDVTVMEKRGDCEIPVYTETNDRSDQEMYMKAMRIYCDLQNGSAYHVDYQWPQLN